MATKSMAYDNAAYQAVLPISFYLSGASATAGFTAFTSMLVKSLTIKPIVTNTSADSFSILQRPTAGTSTTTTAVTTYGSGATAGTNVAGTYTLAQGDNLAVLKGADATGTYGVTFEAVIIPGSNVTV